MYQECFKVSSGRFPWNHGYYRPCRINQAVEKLIGKSGSWENLLVWQNATDTFTKYIIELYFILCCLKFCATRVGKPGVGIGTELGNMFRVALT